MHCIFALSNYSFSKCPTMKIKKIKLQISLTKKSQLMVEEIFNQLNHLLAPFETWDPNQVKKAISQILIGETPRNLLGSRNKIAFQLLCNIIKHFSYFESQINRSKRESANFDKFSSPPTQLKFKNSLKLLNSPKFIKSLNSLYSSRIQFLLSTLVSQNFVFPSVNSPPKKYIYN